jgi:hypothetical protein
MGSWFSSPATRPAPTKLPPPSITAWNQMTPDERAEFTHRQNDSYYSGGGKTNKRLRKDKRKTHRRKR